eukprot:5882109-Pyramimonas_sp.AAC.1
MRFSRKAAKPTALTFSTFQSRTLNVEQVETSTSSPRRAEGAVINDICRALGTSHHGRPTVAKPQVALGRVFFSTRQASLDTRF